MARKRWPPEKDQDIIEVADDELDNTRDKRPRLAHIKARRMSERTCQLFCITARTYRQLRRAVLPLICWQILYFISSTNVVLSPIRLLDYYAGQGLILDEALKCGFAGLSFEINDDNIRQDALSPEGLITQFVYALRMEDHYRSLAHWGTVCSSWIWMSRSSTGRAVWQPLGDSWSASARAGNVMVSRMALVLYLLVAKQVMWIVEQPSSSLMFLHPRLSQFRRWAGYLEARTTMAEYGGSSSKPTTLRGSPPWLQQLERKITPQTRARLRKEGVALADVAEENRRKTVTGNKNLKGSQAYPRGYAKAVVQQLLKSANSDAIDLTADSSSSDYAGAGFDDSDWGDDLVLDEVRTMIGQCKGQRPSPLLRKLVSRRRLILRRWGRCSLPCVLDNVVHAFTLALTSCANWDPHLV